MAPDSVDPRAQAQLDQGNELFARGDLDGAVGCYRLALELAPDWADGHYNLANALHRLGRLEQALDAYDRAVDLRPDHAATRHNRAQALHRLGRLQEAISGYRDATERDSGAPAAWIDLGVALQDQGDDAAAVVALKKAIELDAGQPIAHNNLGNALASLGLASEAEHSFRRALELAPGYAEAQFNLGNALMALGHYGEATRAHVRASELDPGNRTYGLALRRALARRIPGWHLPMLADAPRNAAYRRALERVVTAESRVLDIGAGSGLLSLIAARAGAGRIIACEMDAELAATARQVIADNGYADQITVIAKRSNRLVVGEDLAEPANLLVSELLDTGLLGDGVLPVMRHALAHLTTPDVQVIPRGAVMIGVLVELPGLAPVYPVREVEGFDLSAFDRFRAPDAYLDVDLARVPHTRLSAPFTIASFDFAAPPPRRDERDTECRKLELEVVADGQAQAVVYWFELQMDAVETVSTGPDGDLLHWHQAAQYFEQHRRVETGQHLVLEIARSDHNVTFHLP